MVQEYSVGSLLQGENVLTIILADGWYAGRISVQGGSAQFGNELSVISELTIFYNDGTSETISTDETFIAAIGKHVYSDIFIGEKQDYRCSIPIDKIPQTNTLNVTVKTYDNSNLLLQTGPNVLEIESLKPKSIWKEKENWIIDFGQVIAGYITAELFLNSGQEISIEHGEVLDENGYFINNIVGRNKDQIDKYVGRGKVHHFSPDFTFHGFRYIKIIGFKGEIEKENFTAKVIHSDLNETGTFNCSNEDVNKIMENIKWSQRGNLISIPTDCPQRERVGWTGDIQVFAPTATFFMI